MLYDRLILKPRRCYIVPSGVWYLILTVQKTIFVLDIVPEEMIHQLDFSWSLYNTHKKHQQDVYALPPPTPHYQPASPEPPPPRYFVPKSASQNTIALPARKKTLDAYYVSAVPSAFTAAPERYPVIPETQTSYPVIPETQTSYLVIPETQTSSPVAPEPYPVAHDIQTSYQVTHDTQALSPLILD
ncbi:hypothetical protein CDAR_256311 [Caerostris darwini]|uniref:Uncharacterized protein n=1 Tax=Caerostris darwini TaxID=1538125 RepID=A0AAV4TSB1_9ARAC|nr:hypothetical protein CDAR_256311 [Caerostris darwini]